MSETIFNTATGITEDALEALLAHYQIPPERQKTLTIVRGSETCARKIWLLNNTSEEKLAAIQEAAPTIPSWSVSQLRLDVGNLLEDLAIRAAKAKCGWDGVVGQQDRVHYYSEQHNVLLVGHIDGIVVHQGHRYLLEVKTTSEEVFQQIQTKIGAKGEDPLMLGKYKRQMRRYLGSILALYETLDFAPDIHPTVGKLVIMNRNTCEVDVFDVDLSFTERASVREWLEIDLYHALASDPNVGARRCPSVPFSFFRSHPICETCMFWNECYTGERKPVAVAAELDHLGSDYMQGDAFEKAGVSKKKRVRARVMEVMEELGESRLRLGDMVVASKSQRRGANRIDRDRMREDGVLDTYLVEGKPYNVVSFKRDDSWWQDK